MRADSTIVGVETDAGQTRSSKLPQPQYFLEYSLGAIAPAGYYIALRISTGLPVEELNHMPVGWVEEYTRRGYAPCDPLIRWVRTEIGFARWSSLQHMDNFGVLDRAKAYSMNFGAVVSFQDAGSSRQRSFGIFARSDSEFSDVELEQLSAHISASHRTVAPPHTLTGAEVEALRFVRDGQRLKQVAWQIGITEGAVKQRLKSARLKLGAKTAAEAVARAARFRLL